MASDEELRRRLEAPLDRLEAVGLPRPDKLTLSRFIQVLCEEQLLSTDAATDFLDLHQKLVHGEEEPELEEVDRVSTLVVEQLKSRSERIPAAIHALAELSRPPLPAPSRPEGHGMGQVLRIENLSPTDFPEATELPGNNEHGEPEPVARPWFRRWRLLITIALAYSLLMIAAGYFGSELIERSVQEIAFRAFGFSRASDVDDFRARAAANPDTIDMWRQWARQAERHERWAEAIVAHRHIVARRPQDANALNAFAWLLCTADEAWARDPVQALELAERAYAINPAPHITDTLAEAAFQTGDAVRAVALEEDAIRRLNGNDGFYRRQLSKFRAALPQN